MRTSNGQLTCIEDNLVQTPYGLLITEAKKGESLSPNQIRFLDNISYEFDESKRLNLVNVPEKEFIDFIMFHRIAELSKSLKLIHDLALYHSDVPFDKNEKTALFDLKLLWEGLEKIEKEL